MTVFKHTIEATAVPAQVRCAPSGQASGLPAHPARRGRRGPIRLSLLRPDCDPSRGDGCARQVARSLVRCEVRASHGLRG